MSTLSVPLTSELESFINSMVSEHKADNKAAVVRRALHMLAEEEAVQDVLKASREVREGKYFSGDLDTFTKRIK